MISLRSLPALLVTAAASVPALPARACATCYGASDAPMAQGMNLGILSMLAVVGCVLVSIASFFVVLATRSARTRAQADRSTPDTPSGPVLPS